SFWSRVRIARQNGNQSKAGSVRPPTMWAGSDCRIASRAYPSREWSPPGTTSIDQECAMNGESRRLVSLLGFFLMLPVTDAALAAGGDLPPVSERARRVHAAGMLWDGHNDLPWRLRTEGDMALTKFDLSKRQRSGQTDIPRLREGGVKAQFWSV